MRLNDDLSEPTPQISLQTRPIDQVTLVTNTPVPNPFQLFLQPNSCTAGLSALFPFLLPKETSVSNKAHH